MRGSRVFKLMANLGLAALSLAACALVFEGVLAMGVLDGLRGPRPVYVPQKYRDADFVINRTNHLIAAKNPHYFNDVPRNLDKAPGTGRIAVLGDSFIWGNGLPYDAAWGHKLEKMVCKNHPSIEVLSWGVDGWDTAQETYFLVREGFKYEPDLVIVGFVLNDILDFFHPETYFKWENGSFLRLLRSVLPRSTDFIVAHVKRFYAGHVNKDYDYDARIAGLYTAPFLTRYLQTLQTLKDQCDAHGVELLFVLTPSCATPETRRYFDAASALMDRAGIRHLDLLPAVEKRFSGINPRSLWANPANHHPGEALTTLFAQEVLGYLESGGYFARMMARLGPDKGARCACVEGRRVLAETFPVDMVSVDFIRRDGFCHVLRLPEGFSACLAGRLVVYEDGARLPFPGAPLEDIMQKGGGRYARAGNFLCLSAKDNSDPGENGKKYRVVCKGTGQGYYLHIRNQVEAFNRLFQEALYNPRNPAAQAALVRAHQEITGRGAGL